jgi:hypothetical protein
VRKALLFYLFAEPTAWPDGRPIAESEREAHRAEIQQFSDAVSGDEVEFLFCSYGDLLTGWRESGDSQVAAHGLAVLARFFSPRD